MDKQCEDWYATHATNDELCAGLGPNWAVCRKTPRNVTRWNCVTRKEYDAACKRALAARKQ